MPIKFIAGDVVVTDRDANALAGLAIIGMVAVGVGCYRVGYLIGYHGLDVAMKTKDKIKAKLTK